MNHLTWPIPPIEQMATKWSELRAPEEAKSSRGHRSTIHAASRGTRATWHVVEWELPAWWCHDLSTNMMKSLSLLSDVSFLKSSHGLQGFFLMLLSTACLLRLEELGLQETSPKNLLWGSNKRRPWLQELTGQLSGWCRSAYVDPCFCVLYVFVLVCIWKGPDVLKFLVPGIYYYYYYHYCHYYHYCQYYYYHYYHHQLNQLSPCFLFRHP